MICRWLALVVIVGAVAPAHADGNSAEARRHYEEGNTFYSLGDFQHAAEEYKAAYKAKQDPAFLYNIAQAYRLANDAPNALFFYRSFLRNMPTAPNRREVEDRITKLEAQLAQRDAIAKQPPNSTIPPATGGRTAEPHAATTEPPPAETKASTEVTLPPPTPATHPDLTPPPPAASDNAVTATAPARTPTYKKWWVWTIVGVVVAGAAAGTAAGLVLSKPSAPDSHFGTVSVYQ
jgi:tetratricopeptide (TPR) repeat protein